jgi:hypothetical protein
MQMATRQSRRVAIGPSRPTTSKETTMALRHTSVAPDILTNDDIAIAISQCAHAAKGVGRQLASEPEESGWTPDSPFDHDGFQHLVDAAVENAKHFGKTNHRFFNAEKLADNVLDMMADAFHAGWDAQRGLFEMAGIVIPATYDEGSAEWQDANPQPA